MKALRLVLHTLSTSASRYGRFIEPLLSLSIDFYVRIFIRVQTSPIEVKKSLVYVLLDFEEFGMRTYLKTGKIQPSISAQHVNRTMNNLLGGW